MAENDSLIPIGVLSMPPEQTVDRVMALLTAAASVAGRSAPDDPRRYLWYLLRWSNLLCTEVQPTEAWDHESIVHPTCEDDPLSRLVGPPPYACAHLLGGDRPLWQSVFHNVWRAFSERARASDAEVRYFAEKGGWLLLEVLAHLSVPHRAVFVVRDPRDLLYRIWMRRVREGLFAANMGDQDTPQSFAERWISEDLENRLTFLADIVPSVDRIVVRYERLCEAPREEADRLAQWLGVELDAEALISSGQDRLPAAAGATGCRAASKGCSRSGSARC